MLWDAWKSSGLGANRRNSSGVNVSNPPPIGNRDAAKFQAKCQALIRPAADASPTSPMVDMRANHRSGIRLVPANTAAAVTMAPRNFLLDFSSAVAATAARPTNPPREYVKTTDTMEKAAIVNSRYRSHFFD